MLLGNPGTAGIASRVDEKILGLPVSTPRTATVWAVFPYEMTPPGSSRSVGLDSGLANDAISETPHARRRVAGCLNWLSGAAALPQAVVSSACCASRRGHFAIQDRKTRGRGLALFGSGLEAMRINAPRLSALIL